MNVLALSAFLGLVIVASLGHYFAAHEPIHFVVEHGEALRPYEPGVVYPFGSDLLGRDLISLVLVGARATLSIVLLAGVARVLTGAVIAAVASWWGPTRLAAETVAELAAAIPATLVALVLVRVFTEAETGILTFVGALLLIGWAGPYRVIRAEVARLTRAPYVEGAVAIGLGRSRVFWRYHVPHLVPMLAMNLTQQVVASLVLIAELAVLGVFVGPVRTLDVSESQTSVRVGSPSSALVPDTPEWGAMLATSRTVEALWVTRWLILVPGLAFALTAVAIAVIGVALARRYARRDVFDDLRGAGAIAAVCAVIVLSPGLLPERFAEARSWADAARQELAPVGDTAALFEAAGLRTYGVARDTVAVLRTGPTSITVNQVSISQSVSGTDPATADVLIQSVLSARTGGGLVEAPLVFAGRGIVPSDHPTTRPPARRPVPGQGSGPLIGALIKDYPNDYDAIDVRGKAVLLMRFMGVDAREPSDVTALYVHGPAVETSIMEAIRRGAAAVLFVDPLLRSYTSSDTASPPIFGVRVGSTFNPYLALERVSPARSSTGVPVVALDPAAARTLLEPLGVDIEPLLGYDARDTVWPESPARDLGVNARVEVPVREEVTSVTSVVGEVPGVPDEVGRVLVWTEQELVGSGPARQTQPDIARAEVLAAVARVMVQHRAPFIFIDFDPAADASAVREALKDRPIALVIYLDDLEGGTLRFRTVHGDLIPAFDLYAETVGARYEVTRGTVAPDGLGVIRPFIESKTVVISASGPGDARADAAAVIAYVAARRALGAPELP